jgi:hypothetical protein
LVLYLLRADDHVSDLLVVVALFFFAPPYGLKAVRWIRSIAHVDSPIVSRRRKVP